MPRRARGPYLYFRSKTKTYVIRDKQKELATGCGLEQVAEAERQLGEYIASKWKPEIKRNSSADCTSILMTYVDHRLPQIPTKHRQNELISQVERLVGFWGNRPIRDVIGSTCREYAKKSTTDSMARHDLEIFRAATNHYKREYGLETVPTFTMPAKGLPRPDYMTRSQAARLLLEAHRRGAKHLVRFLLIGYHTGTRSGAIFNLQWFPNTVGGYVDFERNLLYRAPPGQGNSGNKRKPPMRIPEKLLPWLKLWHEQDTADGATIRPIVHYKGRQVKTVKGAFKKAREGAKLPEWVIPHIIRHSAVTWDMQSGKNINDTAQKYGMTVKVLEQTYWHHSPDYQKNVGA